MKVVVSTVEVSAYKSVSWESFHYFSVFFFFFFFLQKMYVGLNKVVAYRVDCNKHYLFTEH